MNLSSVFAIILLAHMTTAWVRFREPLSRRNFLNQSLIEKLQNCAGKEELGCGLCGEGPGEIQTNVIPTEKYTVVDPDVRVLAVDLGFRAGLNGHLEFRVCNVTDNSTADGIACNDTTPLLIGSDVKWYPALTQSSAKSRFRLPRGLVCERCVLQVKYTPGPNSTMNDFRFFDCALLNITHPTKAIEDTISISQESAPKTFPPDHSVMNGSRISIETRSGSTLRGNGSGITRLVNKTASFIQSDRSENKNLIDSDRRTIKQDGSKIIVRRLPSGERTASIQLGKVKSSRERVLDPIVVSNPNTKVRNDRKVVIRTSIVDLSRNNQNEDRSNVDNQARITMIDIQGNNMVTENTANMATRNRANMATRNRSNMATGSATNMATGNRANIATGSTSNMATRSTANIATRNIANVENIESNVVNVADRAIGGTEFINTVEGVQVIKNVQNNAGNTQTGFINAVNVNENTGDTSNIFVNTAVQENTNVNAATRTDINQTFVGVENVKNTNNSRTGVDRTRQNLTVDWKIYTNESGAYYDDNYYYYNDTGSYNDTYYYEDNGSNNGSFVSNLGLPETSIPNVPNENVNTNVARVDRVNISLNENVNQRSDVNKEILSGESSSGKSLIVNRTVLKEVVDTQSDRAFGTGLNQGSGTTVVGTNNDFSGMNVIDNRDVFTRNVVEGADQNQNAGKTTNLSGSRVVTTSDTSSMNTFESVNNEAVKLFGTDSTVMNEGFVGQGGLLDTGPSSLSATEGIKVVQNSVVTVGRTDKSSDLSNNALDGSSNASQTMVTRNVDRDVSNKSTLINETIQLMADLNVKTSGELNKVDISADAIVGAANVVGTDQISIVKTDKKGQQIVSVPHTIIVLPKGVSDHSVVQVDMGYLNEHNTSAIKEVWTTEQNEMKSNSLNYTLNEPTSYTNVEHRSQETFVDRNQLVDTRGDPNTDIVTNSALDVSLTLTDTGSANNDVSPSQNNVSTQLDTVNIWNSVGTFTDGRSEINTHEGTTAFDEFSGSTPPEFLPSKKFSYAISAADRRPNYATKDRVVSGISNTDTSRSTVELDSLNSDSKTATDESGRMVNGIFTHTFGSTNETIGTQVDSSSQNVFNFGNGHVDASIRGKTDAASLPVTFETAGNRKRGQTNVSNKTTRMHIENISQVSDLSGKLQNNNQNSFNTIGSQDNTFTMNVTRSTTGVGNFDQSGAGTNSITSLGSTITNVAGADHRKNTDNIMLNVEGETHMIEGLQSDINRVQSSVSGEHVVQTDGNIKGSTIDGWGLLSSDLDVSNQPFNRFSSPATSSVSTFPTSLPPINVPRSTTEAAFLTSLTNTNIRNDNIVITRNNVNAWDEQHYSDIGVSNQLFDRQTTARSEPVENLPTTTMPSVKPIQPAVKMLDVSTRAYDHYIGIPSTTVPPLNVDGSTFVRLVNYSTVTSNAVFQVPDHVVTSSSNSLSLDGTGRSDQSLEAMFLSTPGPEIPTTTYQFSKEITNYDASAVENRNVFSSVNFLGETDASIDRLGGVPIQGSQNNMKSDATKNVAENNRASIVIANTNQQTNTIDNSDFDISNQLGQGVVFLKDGNSKEVIWRAPFSGYAIPVGNFSIDPSLQLDKSNSNDIIEIKQSDQLSGLQETNLSGSKDGLETTNVLENGDRSGQNDLKIGKTVIWQSMTLSGLSEGAKRDDSNINALSANGIKAGRNLDISVNGNAVVNKIQSRKEGAVEVLTESVNVPDVMPPIEILNLVPEIKYKLGKVTTEFRTEKATASTSSTPASQNTKKNFILFTPYITNIDNNRLAIQHIETEHTNINTRPAKIATEAAIAANSRVPGGQAATIGVNWLNKEANKQANSFRAADEVLQEKSESHNLSVSSMWDINRGNTDLTSGDKSSSFASVPESSVVDMNTEYRLRNFSTKSGDSGQGDANSVTTTNGASAIGDQGQSNVNKQVLRTLEALVLELEAMENKPDKTRRPIVHSSAYRTVHDRSMKRDRLLSSFPLFRVSPNLLEIPNNHVIGQFDQRRSNTQRGSQNHRLLNMLGIANQRVWNSDINLNTTIDIERKADSLNKNRSVQQVVNFAGMRPRGADRFGSLLSTFADISTGTANKNINVVETPIVNTVVTDTVTANEVSDDNGTVTQLIDLVTPFDSSGNSGISKEQRIIRTPSSVFLNPFTGKNITFSRSDKFIARGIGNLQHLKGVENLYHANLSPNFTMAQYNFTPSSDQDGFVAIEGKYFPGQMRRNEIGQFEPVPLASNFDSSTAETVAPTVKRSNDRLLQELSLDNNFRPIIYQTSKEQQNDMMKNGDKGIMREPVKAFVFNSGILTTDTTSRGQVFGRDQNIIVKNQETFPKGKKFFSQEDLLKTNGILTEKSSAGSTDIKSGATAVRSEFRQNSVKCEQHKLFVCTAVGKNRHIPGMVWWCFSHCQNGVCPPEKCSCRCENVRQETEPEPRVKIPKDVNVSGTKRRKKVIHLTLNTPSESKIAKTVESKAKHTVVDIIRPKVLNATVTRFNQVERPKVLNSTVQSIEQTAWPNSVRAPVNNWPNGVRAPVNTFERTERPDGLNVTVTHFEKVERPKVLNATMNTSERVKKLLTDNEQLLSGSVLHNPGLKCIGINAFADTVGIDELCTRICMQSVCPETICMCFSR